MYYYSNSYANPLSFFYNSISPQYTAPIRYFLNKQSDTRCISKAEADYLAMNRLLWMEHVNWTRMTIMGIVFNLPDLPFVQKRLLKNATDLGNCLRPFYGNQIADQYAQLIKEHLVLAAELVTAATKRDQETAQQKEKAWYKNADNIAAFLSSINPFINKTELQKMLYTHLSLTKDEAVNMIQKNYEADVEVFDKIEAEALAMSDMIASAIVMQFFCPYFQCYYC